jgi:serine/threonine-protein kinase RsbW
LTTRGTRATVPPLPTMTPPDSRTVKLDVASRFDMLDVVQTVLAQLSGIVGFDDEQAHYLSVAVRECVVNAIKHGNARDETKRVEVEFKLQPRALEISVRDEGKGFDPAAVPDPVAPENLLKADGRGIFFMKQFVDDLQYAFPKTGGTLVRMVKRR